MLQIAKIPQLLQIDILLETEPRTIFHIYGWLVD